MIENETPKPKRRRWFLIIGGIVSVLFMCIVVVAIGLFLYQDTLAPLEVENPAGEVDPDLLAQFDPSAPPEFVVQDCPVRTPDEATVECGTILVPQDWNDPQPGEAVALAVAVYRSTNPNPKPDPVIYLDGGPGGFTLELLPFVFEDNIQPFLAERDYITFDQRGIGYSEPALDCPNLKELELSYLDSRAEWEDVKPEFLAATAACSENLTSQGIDLSTYGSAASAADVDAIRQALGIEQWNLFGVSYGTRLAQTVMRDHPAGVRSVILDSAYPVEADLYENVPRSMNEAFRVFFDSCAADPACSQQYPDLENRFYALVEELNENPLEIEIQHWLNGSRYDALFWGDDLIGMLFQTLYSETMFIDMPDIIDDIENGELDDVIQMRELFFVNDDFFSGAVYTTIQCREEYPFSIPENAQDEIEKNPRLAEYFDGYDYSLESCSSWGAGQANPIENEPVVSDIPTLILAGGFDPVTPPWWGQSLQSNLSNSYFVEIPQLAHGIFSANDCTNQIGLDFIDQPGQEPNSACKTGFAEPEFSEPD